MNTKVIIFIILVVLWGLLFVRNTKAEAPLVDISVPLEVQDNPIKKFAYNQVKLRWDESHWSSFNNIVNQESWNWRITKEHYKGGYTKDGVKSSAYGLCGFLNSTWADTGYTKTEDPYTQIAACIEYVDDRYGNPKNAWSFHIVNNWF